MSQDKLESIIVSFNCLDLLSITLPRNLPELDHVIIVTKPEDIDTINYCKSLKSDKITVFPTDSFTFGGAKFNKGLAIALAMRQLKYNSFFATMDTDIILPKGFKQDFFNLNPGKEYFCGFRRINIDTKEEFYAIENGDRSLDSFLCYRGSGYGYLSAIHFQSRIYQDLLKKWDGLGYPFWVQEARDIDWIWRNHWGERIFDPPLGEFPKCHLEPNEDCDTGLYKELPIRVLHLGMPGLNHEVRVTEKF